LSIDKQQDYKSLVKALEERFVPPNQTELYRVQPFKFWGRDCLMRILISESTRASIKCCFNQLKNEIFRPCKFDNTPRFNYGRGQVYGQNYGRGQGYGHNFGRGDGHFCKSDSRFCISVINFIMSV
jgi:hypothetical protein